MLLKIDDTLVDVVEGANIELEKEGGIEGYYGSKTGKHAKGMKRATFTLRRWFKENTDPDILFDLFDLDLPFSLSGEIDGQSNSKITLSDCEIYRYRLIMGGVNDIVAEEAQGEAVDWTSNLA